MTCDELTGILSSAPSLSVAVLGDFCLDAYWVLDESRVERSVETGLATRAVRRQRYALGGAGNVVTNLKALGVGRVDAYGVIGSDLFGAQMIELLRAIEVKPDGLFMQRTDWQTHVYIKPLIRGREDVRIDFGNYNRLSKQAADSLLQRLERLVEQYGVVIINEQVAFGLHRRAVFRKGLAELIARHPLTTFILDSRHYGDRYDGAMRKLNEHEALRLCGVERAEEEIVRLEEARGAADRLYERWGKPVFITRGDRGCVLCDEQGVEEIPGLLLVGRTDAVGAGDSMLSGIALALAAGQPPPAAAALGNFVAGVTVRKIFQTGVATPAEVLSVGKDPDYVYRPELADDPRWARHVKDTEIELVTSLDGNRVPPTHAVFDHDGTISTLREGWEAVMEPVMLRAILGKRYDDADETLYHKVVSRVRDYIDKTTGIQTLSQMEGLVDMVREFECVPAAEIRDAAGYKSVYLEALMDLVRQRIAKLRRGELSVEDFTVKGAVDFLHDLRAAGVRLYMASGTDRADVVAEAEALGYAGLFEGRIHGAEEGVRTEAKKRVLERILSDIGSSGGASLVTFGDGPVEIRETRKTGGFTVGVASDEVRRFGLHHSKRSRLIRAGADLIVPDFSQGGNLLELLWTRKGL